MTARPPNWDPVTNQRRSRFSGCTWKAATTGMCARRARASAAKESQNGNWRWTTSAPSSAASSVDRRGNAMVKPLARIARTGSWKPGRTRRAGCSSPPVVTTTTSCPSRSASTKRTAERVPPETAPSKVSVTKAMRNVSLTPARATARMLPPSITNLPACMLAVPRRSTPATPTVGHIMHKRTGAFNPARRCTDVRRRAAFSRAAPREPRGSPRRDRSRNRTRRGPRRRARRSRSFPR